METKLTLLSDTFRTLHLHQDADLGSPNRLVPSPTSIHEVSCPPSPPPVSHAVVIQGYNDKLRDSQHVIEQLRSEMQSLKIRTENVIKENDQLRKELSITREFGKETDRTRLLEKENELLLDQVRKTEQVASQAFSCQNQVKTLTSHLDALRILTSTQSETIKTLGSTVSTLETKLFQANDIVLSLRSTNKDLISRFSKKENELSSLRDKKEKLAWEMEKRESWLKRVERLLVDYQRSLECFGIKEALAEHLNVEGKDDAVASTNLLEAKVVKLRDEYNDTKKKSHAATVKLESLEKEFACVVQKLRLELERKSTELEKSNEHLTETITLAERIKFERDQAMKNAESLAREAATLEDKLKQTQLSKDEEMNNLLTKSNEQLKTLREQYDFDHEKMTRELNILKQSKVDLQCEIGVLLRDKRALEFELNNVMRNMETQRGKFRAVVGI